MSDRPPPVPILRSNRETDCGGSCWFWDWDSTVVPSEALPLLRLFSLVRTVRMWCGRSKEVLQRCQCRQPEERLHLTPGKLTKWAATEWRQMVFVLPRWERRGPLWPTDHRTCKGHSAALEIAPSTQLVQSCICYC